MNDDLMMTKSFMNYVELKKQSAQDTDIPESDLEKGHLHPEEPRKEDDNINQLLGKVRSMEAEMDELTKLLHSLTVLVTKDSKSKSTYGKEGMRDRVDSDMMAILLGKAKNVKTTLEWLYKSSQGKGSITNGFRAKLRESVEGVMALSLEMKMGVVGEGDGRVVEKDEGVMKELEEVLVEMGVMVMAESNGEDEISSCSLEEEEEAGCVIGDFVVDRIIKGQRNNCRCWVGLFLLLVMVVLIASLAR